MADPATAGALGSATSGAPGSATSGAPGSMTSGAPGSATSGAPGSMTSGAPGSATSGAPGSVPALRPEVEFTLPNGYVDAAGTVHRVGRMRLATARDELAPLVDPRVARDRAYLVVLLLARVVTRLGSLPEVTPEVVEGLYASDFSYLQRLYRRLNMDPLEAPPSCPSCGAALPPEVVGLGGAGATPHT